MKKYFFKKIKKENQQLGYSIFYKNVDVMRKSVNSKSYLSRFVNKHNCRYWSNENDHVFVEGHTQNPQKINVWANMLGNQVIGPLFINGNLNDEVYLNMLEDTINPVITEAID